MVMQNFIKRMEINFHLIWIKTNLLEFIDDLGYRMERGGGGGGGRGRGRGRRGGRGWLVLDEIWNSIDFRTDEDELVKMNSLRFWIGKYWKCSEEEEEEEGGRSEKEDDRGGGGEASREKEVLISEQTKIPNGEYKFDEWDWFIFLWRSVKILLVEQGRKGHLPGEDLKDMDR
jgi:hypothetical protein